MMETHGKDLRRFVRLRWRYPVEFSIITFEAEIPGMGWKQGFTENVSAEGMRLDAVGLAETTVNYLKNHKVNLRLRIDAPTTELPVKAVGEVVWHRMDDDGLFSLGVRFTTIAESDLRRILKYAHWRKSLRNIILVFSLFAFCLAVFLYFQ